MRKATKTFISFAVVLIAGLNYIIPAFAQDPFTSIAIGGITGASGAGLFGSMAGMSGISIGWSQSGSDPLDAMWNVLNPDHVYFSGEKHEATGTPEDLYDYITVDLGDWLLAQRDFIDEFVTNYNVSDNDSGTVTTSETYYGYPFTTSYSSYKYGPEIMKLGVGSYSIGNLSVEITDNGRVFILTITDGQSSQSTPVAYDYAGQSVVLFKGSNIIGVGRLASGNLITMAFVSNSDFDPQETVAWSSGTVNTSVFDGWESAKVKIPHNISGLSPNWTIPEFLGAINNLWTQNQQGQIVIEDTDQPVPPPPVPTTPLGDVPFDDWVDLWGQGIYQQLENQSDALDLIGSNGIDAIEELESIDTNTEDLVEVAESIDTNIGVGNGILGGIRSLAQSAVNYLEGIAEHVGELVEEIVEGTETLIAGILNQIPQAFGVIFGPIKQASSIWHYVVEWIQSIGAPFQFIWSMASGTSYYVILPVYASLAAAVVLSFFKRFGR